MKRSVLFRKGHRWGALLVSLPLLLVIVTGLLLQLKKDWSWVQPPTQRGTGKVPLISFEQILAAAVTDPKAAPAGITGWSDIDRIDVQPGRGMAKLQAKNRWEVQVDLADGAVLQCEYRRSDLIESLHDGSWFDDTTKLYVFLPAGIVLFGLWCTGMYLFFMPLWVKWRRGRKA